MQAVGFTVGPVQENAWLAFHEGRAVIVDPGEEAERLLKEIADRELALEAILITHCHFDHVGAVAAVARATGAPVYCPTGEVEILENINDYVRFPGFGPFEPYSPEHTVQGGDRLTLAGMEFDVISTPGHSPDHVTYAVPGAIFSGDVLFQGSIGRTDLPGCDHGTLMESIATLLDTLPDETNVLPGHMAPTTLGAERATNPFLRELAAR
jgi:glyoxylase-like metal-dependent hydrolase (beta-lactamase superfamily II)